MKLVEGIAITAAALLAYNLFAKKLAAGTLNFSPGAFKSLGFNGATPVVTVGINVQNTSNQTYTLNSIAGNVFTMNNGKEFNIGNISNFQPQKIYPNSQQTLWINLTLSFIGVVTDLINVLKSGSTFKQDVEVQGYANVDGMQVPFDFNYTLGG